MGHGHVCCHGPHAVCLTGCLFYYVTPCISLNTVQLHPLLLPLQLQSHMRTYDVFYEIVDSVAYATELLLIIVCMP